MSGPFTAVMMTQLREMIHGAVVVLIRLETSTTIMYSLVCWSVDTRQ